MEFSEEQKRQLAGKITKNGDVFYIEMNEANGIKPHEGYSSRKKYFTVVGKNEEEVMFAGLVINSKINPNIPVERQIMNMPLKMANNPFLEYDSFIDCAELKTVGIEKMEKFTYVGELFHENLQLAIDTVKGSKFASKRQLQEFGLL